MSNIHYASSDDPMWAGLVMWRELEWSDKTGLIRKYLWSQATTAVLALGLNDNERAIFFDVYRRQALVWLLHEMFQPAANNAALDKSQFYDEGKVE